MLKKNSLLFFAIFTIWGFSSCKRHDNGPNIYQSWGIAINPANSTPKFILDWNFPNQSIVNNLNNVLGISNIPDSVRLLMYYSFANPSVDSNQININSISTFLTKKLQPYTASSDTFGTNPLYNVTYPQQPFFTQNYLTIPFAFYYTPNSSIEHKIALVYNETNGLWNTTFDTMLVEFRHNANGDIGNFTILSTLNWVAFNMNSLRPIGATKDSFYIKMSYLTSTLSTGTQNQTYIVPAKWR